MPDKFPPVAQRPALLTFAKALGSRDSALCRDACDDWLSGAYGHVYAIPGSLDEPNRPGWQFFAARETERQWNFARKAISAFAKVCNDGDEGGGFIMHRLPTKAEAETIRRYLGIPKKRDVSEAELERLRTVGRQHAFLARATPAAPPA